MLQAQNGMLNLCDGEMDYIRFGSGDRTLVMLPGLGEALRSVKGTAKPMAWMYRIFAEDFTVYMFNRKKELPEGYSTRDMARDQSEAMELLGITKADVFGVSMGGMIAQHLAIDFPEKVNRLVLAVTCAKPNAILEESIGEWVDCARKDDHVAFMDSNLRRIYSEDYYRKNKWMIPAVGKLTKPKSYDRFFIQAEACLNHNAHDGLANIQSATLVVGGEQDKALGGDASREIAERIPQAELLMYPQWGHGLYEEAGDFNERVLAYLQK